VFFLLSKLIHFQYFRTNLPEKYLALVPHLGYERMGQQSTKARRFLKWLAEAKGWDIQHVDNGGEKRYRQVKLTLKFIYFILSIYSMDMWRIDRAMMDL
jgi:hypothetical protein